jgi:hypothetical protein
MRSSLLALAVFGLEVCDGLPTGSFQHILQGCGRRRPLGPPDLSFAAGRDTSARISNVLFFKTLILYQRTTFIGIAE